MRTLPFSKLRKIESKIENQQNTLVKYKKEQKTYNFFMKVCSS